MIEVFERDGAPRDLGFDQGRECRERLGEDFRRRSRWARALSTLWSCREERRRISRDLRRHFPQHAEVIEGMARSARVPQAWLVEMLSRESSAAPLSESLALAVAANFTAGGSLLARFLPADGLVRRSHPDSGFRSVELTQPWRTTALAGVNEVGLAVAAISGRVPVADTGCAVPALLLAQDCLQRFAHLDGALDWLMARPGGGEATILLADAAGECAGVHIRGTHRRVIRAADGLIVHTEGHHREAEVAKALHHAQPIVTADLGRYLGLNLVAAEPAQRRIGVFPAQSFDNREEHWFEV